MIRPASVVVFSLALNLFNASAIAMKDGFCSLNPPPTQVPRSNIFTPQQEQWLGDALSDMIESRYTLQPADQSAYVSQVGEKLVAQLPDAAVHYAFRVFESADLRSFSFAGGHIYISRKMLLDARSEDEIAAMLAVEIGRVYTHHSASLVTLRLRKMLNVKSVGDQADVVDKFQRLLNVPIPSSAQLNQADEKKDELVADRVALFVLVKAGYSPKAFIAFLDRINLNGGYTGNFLSDLFEATPDVSMRIRQANKLVDALPASCLRVRAPYRPAFKPYEDALYAQRIDPLLPPTPGLLSTALSPPLSPALENVRLSSDGKYVLAQDEAQIHILSTTPLKHLFSIDAREAAMAQFTPDSSAVVFHYPALRVENWNVATQQPAGILDFPDYFGCEQTGLSPDGNTFACLSRNNQNIWLRLIDLPTSTVVYQNTAFHNVGYEYETTTPYEPRLADTGWSQDSRYFLAVAGTDRFAIDLKDRNILHFKGPLSDLYQSPFAFVDSHSLVFSCDWIAVTSTNAIRSKTCSTTFPDGQSPKTFNTASEWISPVTRGTAVLSGPFNHSAAVLRDSTSGTVLQSFNLEPVDLAGETVAREAEHGGVSVGKLGGPAEIVAVPITPLPVLEAAAFSADGRFLAISNRARGSIWNLTTGRQVTMTGPFRVATFNANDQLEAQLLNQELKPSADEKVDWRTHKMIAGLTVGSAVVQYGDVVVKLTLPNLAATVYNDTDVEATDAVTGKHLWSRHFLSGTPEFAQADAGRFLLLMNPYSSMGDSDMHHYKSILVRASDEIRRYDEEGLLVEVVAARTGEPQRLLLVPELVSSTGEARSAQLFGDLLAVRTGRNNSVVYRTTDGARLMAFFGHALAGDTSLGLIAATNRAQELFIYDVATGNERIHVTLDEPALAARFIPSKRQLLVLSASQHVYAIDLPAASPSQPAIAH